MVPWWTRLSPVKVWLSFRGADRAVQIRLVGILLFTSVTLRAKCGLPSRLWWFGNRAMLKKLVTARGVLLGCEVLQVTMAVQILAGIKYGFSALGRKLRVVGALLVLGVSAIRLTGSVSFLLYS